MSQNAFEELIWRNRDYDGCENVTKVNFRSFKLYRVYSSSFNLWNIKTSEEFTLG